MLGEVQVLAEKRALELAAEAGLKLIAICPNFVLGPPLSTRVDGLSVGFMKVGRAQCRDTSASMCSADCHACAGRCQGLCLKAQRCMVSFAWAIPSGSQLSFLTFAAGTLGGGECSLWHPLHLRCAGCGSCPCPCCRASNRKA